MNSQRHARQRGVGLIEILVAVVLISIGFLAAAQMQVQSMRYSQGAYFQSQAYFLASDIIDRMRANVDGVVGGDYDGLTTSSSASNPQCNVNACSAAQMAQQDLYDWSANFHDLRGTSNFFPALPSGSNVTAGGSITETAPGQFTITLNWSEVVNGQDEPRSLSVNYVNELPTL